MKSLALTILLLTFFNDSIFGQSLFVAGPMPGYTELRTARVWVEVSRGVDSLNISWWSDGQERRTANSKMYTGILGSEFNPITFTLTGLQPGTRYRYEIAAINTHNRATEKTSGMFTTQALWQWRTTAPDFSFLTGSCAYFNEPQYDRPGKPYGGDSSIFLAMAKRPADFMLWLGDNWYTREADYMSTWGLRYRAHHDRSLPVLQPLLKAMPHYAIWDDHDFGPNDYGASYIYSSEGRAYFADYWPNPSYGQEGKGIYTQFNYSDVAFFLLDDRTWRSSDAVKDSIDGKPNPQKHMLGTAQMAWLKDALLMQKDAPFKIIVNGSQVLNPLSPFDCMRHFGTEWQELMDFIAEYDINGVIFLTGDRHHSEIIRMERKETYPLYDVTVSPFTSGPAKPAKAEENMPQRVPGTLIMEQNFGHVSVSGSKKARVLKVQFLDISGAQKAAWQVSEADLKRKER